jgi:hypothetical protein
MMAIVSRRSRSRWKRRDDSPSLGQRGQAPAESGAPQFSHRSESGTGRPFVRRRSIVGDESTAEPGFLGPVLVCQRFRACGAGDQQRIGAPPPRSPEGGAGLPFRSGNDWESAVAAHGRRHRTREAARAMLAKVATAHCQARSAVCGPPVAARTPLEAGATTRSATQTTVKMAQPNRMRREHIDNEEFCEPRGCPKP